MDSVARALDVDETRGFMRAVVDEESEQILGAAILGASCGTGCWNATTSPAWSSRTAKPCCAAPTRSSCPRRGV